MQNVRIHVITQAVFCCFVDKIIKTRNYVCVFFAVYSISEPGSHLGARSQSLERSTQGELGRPSYYADARRPRAARSDSYSSLPGAMNSFNIHDDALLVNDGTSVGSYHSIQELIAALAPNNFPPSRTTSAATLADIIDMGFSIGGGSVLDTQSVDLDVSVIAENVEQLVDEFNRPRIGVAFDSIDSILMYSAILARLGRRPALSVGNRMDSANTPLADASREPYTQWNPLCRLIGDSAVNNTAALILQEAIWQNVQHLGGTSVWFEVFRSSLFKKSTSDSAFGAAGANAAPPIGTPRSAIRAPSSATRISSGQHNSSDNNAVPSDVSSSDNISENGFLRGLMLSNLLPLLRTVDTSSNASSSAAAQYCRLRILSDVACECLLSLVLCAPGTAGRRALGVVSNLVNGNPFNSDVIVKSDLAVALAWIVLGNDRIVTGNVSALVTLLGQISQHQMSGSLLRIVLECTKTDKDNTPDKSESDERSRQAFYIMGQAAERRGPTIFFHFTMSNPFLSYALLSPTTPLPPAKTGFTLSTWLKPGFVGNVPINILCQLGIRNSEIVGRSVVGMSVYFRVVEKSLRSPEPSSARGTNAEAGDSGPSVRSLQLCVSYCKSFPRGDIERDWLAGVNRIFRRVPEAPSVTLPVAPDSFLTTRLESESWSTDHGTYTTDNMLRPESNSSPTAHYNAELKQDADSRFSAELAESLTMHLIPDVIVNYPFSEQSEWTHVSISWGNENAFSQSDQSTSASSLGFICHINGSVVPVSVWTPLGYLTADQLMKMHSPMRPLLEFGKISIPTFYSSNQGVSSSFTASVGGLHVEADSYFRCIAMSRQWAARSEFSIGEQREEEALKRLEIDMLKLYSSYIHGFGGCVSDFSLLVGIPSLTAVKRYVESSRSSGIQDSADSMCCGLKRLCALNVKALPDDSPNDIIMPISGDYRHNHSADEFRFGNNKVSNFGPILWDHETISAVDGDGKSRIDGVSKAAASIDSNSTASSSSQTTSLVSDWLGIFSLQNKSEPVPPKDSSILLPSKVSQHNGAVDSSTIQFNVRSMETHWRKGFVRHQSGAQRACTACSQLRSGRKQLLSLPTLKHMYTVSLSEILPEIGGLKNFFNQLCSERRFQVAAMRILVSLLTAHGKVYQEFLRSKVDGLVLHCLCRSKRKGGRAHTAIEVLQILFDFAVLEYGAVEIESAVESAQGRMVQSIPSSVAAGDLIRQVPVLRLLIDIACANPTKPKVARCIIDWLRGICEDSHANISKVLDSCGVLSFLIILSLWTTVDIAMLMDEPEVPSEDTIVTPTRRSSKKAARSLTPPLANSDGQDDYVVGTVAPVTPPTRRQNDRRDTKKGSDGAGTRKEKEKTDSRTSKEFYRLQLTSARFLKQLITGSFGDYNGAPQPASLVTPTGFNISQLNSIINFLLLLSTTYEALFPEYLLL
jgi:hypothetical protein